ncbi:putative ABC transporter substrate-binding lipoprotein YvgL [Phocicoccus schoeneichii]|uniref:Molybdate-binding periplasmic protein n=1 Tax=Phocicoccus schoeneichii TaxID=1812261 RepID=A0A6V7RB33_9BACL|nr:molybdate ABC transporter substrate-binding protein [Jeotgalicoccus schoeneichii]GGH52946.1 putative ABC transporter substrate-binding lipoprotein YvgL [Jeotgalicoccus schoeneichii]CAD2074188.1 Molybdate-binding periplasmic protein precursor [Jeotgalicoccus schoeneichii]
MKRLIVLFVITLFLVGCGTTETEDAATTTESKSITVSAAASLTDALQEIEDIFKESNLDIEIDFNFGGSGALREQIKQGAPVDMVVFASQKDFDLLGESEMYIKEQKLLENTLVLVTPKGNDTVTDIDSLVNAKNIAVGTAESVPAGKYAEQSFNSLGLTGKIEDKFIYAEDVRAVLQYVAQDEVDAGVVYKTDALTEDKVEIVDTFLNDVHDKIIYPAGTLTDNESVNAFYKFLTTDEAKDVFEKYGFKVE